MTKKRPLQPRRQARGSTRAGKNDQASSITRLALAAQAVAAAQRRHCVIQFCDPPQSGSDATHTNSSSHSAANTGAAESHHAGAAAGKPDRDTSVDNDVGRIRQMCRSIPPVLLKFQQIFPHKTTLELALRLSRPVALRTIERWLEGANELPSWALADLIRADVGRDILTVMMETSAAPWWRAFEEQTRLASLRDGIRELEASVRQIERRG